MEIIRTTQFKKDFKKVRHDTKTVELFLNALQLLVNKHPLPEMYNEHQLTGNLKGFSDIHIKPDLLLLYKIDTEKEILYLSRIGSHSELFG
jgi:mRNA interferase YafQ